MLDLQVVAVTVNQKTCIGCGRCAATAPEVFRIRKGKSGVRDGADYSVGDYIRAAERNCPSNSIKVFDAADQ
ncbi:MAG: ferredoxin [Candidatus Sericytochromatia bacterium]|nr:ferredoxin [Candidatus Tanganyikabacteria bacterium]